MNFDENETAKQRMKIIRFYENYGEKAVKGQPSAPIEKS